MSYDPPGIEQQARDMRPIRSACNLLFAPGQTVEVRLLGKRGTASGFFDMFDCLESSVTIKENEGEYSGIYVTLNPVNPDLLARRANRIETRLGRDEKSAADSDILSRRWLPIDIDPVRPSGVSSTKEEHAEALEKADRIAAYLTDLGWPEAVMADSGNGAHLLYRIDLPNDDNAQNLIRNVLKTLDTLFSDERSNVDTSVYNAGRIWKLYGTTSRKGDTIAARPHRKARLLSVPDTRVVVAAERLIRLAGMFPEQQQVPKDQQPGATIDLGAWLSRHGLSCEEKPYAGGSLFVLHECPFSSDHRDGAYAIQFPNGAIFAGCHHDSCGGGTQRWAELRNRYEPDRMLRVKRSSSPSPAAPTTAVPGSAPEVKTPGSARQEPNSSAGFEADVSRILTDTHPLRYMLDTFTLDHEGDLTVAESLIMSLASRLVLNSKGLHVSITGESGKGKSHAISTVLKQVPPAHRLDGRISEKALFYITDLRPGTVIALDDHALSDQMQEILKGVTSSFHHQFVYRTVSKDRTGQVCTIPERCVWWIAKVDGTGDDQVFNRMLTCWIDDSDELDLRVLERSLSHACKGPICGERERDENLICQEIWETLVPAFVIIPFADRIRFVSAANRRNPDMLLDLIRSSSILMQQQRKEENIDEVRCIYATEEDFAVAARLYTALNGESGSQASKLTRREAELVTIMHESGRPEYTINDLQTLTGWNNSTIHKLLNGYLSKGQTYSGLLAKCPAVSFYDRTVTSGSDGKHTQRRMRVYTWDPALYLPWSEGGVVWLAAEQQSPGPDDGGQGGSAAEDGIMRNNAGGCRPEIAAYPSSDLPIIKDCTGTDQRAAEDQSMKQEISSGDTGDHHGSDPGNCRIAAQGDLIPANEGRIADHGADLRVAERHSLPHGAAFADRSPESRIRSADFVEVEGWPQKTPCVICGSPSTRYRERTAHAGSVQRMLCPICFEAAQVRESLSVRTIPGIIDTRSMQHRSSPTGKCSVCRTGAAVWVDPDQQIALCDTCYNREQSGRKGEK